LSVYTAVNKVKVKKTYIIRWHKRFITSLDDRIFIYIDNDDESMTIERVIHLCM